MDFVAVVIMTSWAIFLHIHNTNLVTVLGDWNHTRVGQCRGVLPIMLAIIGAAMMIIVSFTMDTALLATLVIRSVFF